MTKINYGYDTSLNPTGSHEGMGANKNEKNTIIEGELVELFTLDGKTYLVSKSTMVMGDKNNEMTGNYDVRDIIADLFPDGSAIFFLDEHKSRNSLVFEQLFNNEKSRELLEKGIKPKELVNGHYPSPIFIYQGALPSMTVTSIPSEVFEQKRDLINNCHKSISAMQEEILSKENGISL